MPALIDTIEGTKIAGHHPCPRLVVNEDGWCFVASQLSAGYWTLVGLWGDTGAVHMAVLDAGVGEIAVVTMLCPDGHFPSWTGEGGAGREGGRRWFGNPTGLTHG